MSKISNPLLFIICIILSVNLSGCWNARELNALSIVVAIGIDKADVPDNVSLTAQIVKPGEIKKPAKDASGGEAKAFWNVKSSALTVFDAVRGFTYETSNKLYLSHSQVIIIGNDTAMDGVQKYLDFFMRSHETRPTTKIFVTDGTAGEILDVSSETEKLPAINIAKLAKAQEFTSQSKQVNFQDFINRLLSKTTSPIAPLVSITRKGEKPSAYISGMAVFKGDKLAGVLNRTETRGLLWVTGEVKSGAIDIDYHGGKVTIEILKAESKIKTEIKNSKVLFNVEIKEESSLASQTIPENLLTVAALDSLESLQNELIKSEILSAIKKAKHLNTDIFGFGEKIHGKYKSEWKQMESKWDEIFPSIEVQIKIESQIHTAGLITRPAVPASKE